MMMMINETAINLTCKKLHLESSLGIHMRFLRRTCLARFSQISVMSNEVNLNCEIREAGSMKHLMRHPRVVFFFFRSPLQKKILLPDHVAGRKCEVIGLCMLVTLYICWTLTTNEYKLLKKTSREMVEGGNCNSRKVM